MTLVEAQEGLAYVIHKLEGDTRLLSRITAMGLTPGCKLTVLHNQKKRPVLIAARDSAIALDRSDCEGVLVEVMA